MPWLLPLVVFGLVWGEFPPKLPEDFFDKVKAVIDRCEEVTESLQTVKPTGIDVLAIIYDPEEKAFQRWLFETRPDISAPFENGTKTSNLTIFKLTDEQARTLKRYRIFVQTRGEEFETGGYFAYGDGKEIVAAIHNDLLIREAEGSVYYLMGDYMYRVSSDAVNDLQRMYIRNHTKAGDGVWTDIMDSSILSWNDIITPRNDKQAFNFILESQPNVCYQEDSPDKEWTKTKSCEPIYPVLEKNGKTEWYSLKVIRMIYPACVSDLDDTLTNNTYFRLTNVFIPEEKGEEESKSVIYIIVGVLVFLLLICCITALILLLLWRRRKQLERELDIYEVTCVEPSEDSSSKSGTNSYTARSPRKKSKEFVNIETVKGDANNVQMKEKKSNEKLSDSGETNVTMQFIKKPAPTLRKKLKGPLIPAKEKVNVDKNLRISNEKEEASRSAFVKRQDRPWLIADKNAELFAKIPNEKEEASRSANSQRKEKPWLIADKNAELFAKITNEKEEASRSPNSHRKEKPRPITEKNAEVFPRKGPDLDLRRKSDRSQLL